MKVAVIDCSVTGHRETYYKEFTRTWAALGEEVLLIAPREPETGSIAAFKRTGARPLLPLPTGQPLRKKITVMRNALIRLRNLATLRRQLVDFRPDLVYFPCLDDILPTFAPIALFNRLLPYSWSGLLVQSALPPYKPGMPDVRPFLRSRHCRGIGVLNEYSTDELKDFQTNICRLPDFADLSAPDETYPLLHTLKKHAGGRRIISLLGSIGTRKGIGLLLSTIPFLPEDEYFFLIAGKSWLTETQNLELKSFEASRNNCLFSLTHIPDEACFNALVSASDVLFAAYRKFTGSSNLLTKAAAFGKPVIVSQGECMGKRVTDYGTGFAVPEEDPEACRTAIIRLCREGTPSPEGLTRYASEHSQDKLADILRQLITNK
ncbi:glycosyltransferase [Bacteroides helcogenes]|uniref:Glycosyl transferase group 1 n=1 Tax=Bacteroides helcogenes (strain ATCC 35417 / DSM 20613 / JCM 6297 / CCUG 15421 / P 36-108) TaxID=693979 RepID=E6SPI8_BACT6|nr:glycosyltransferase [Bacteroides helcogenes]ADV42877.1 glycosyl transferase group 1 [Bacteroides helcogenes P 36-108]MDY5238218.1 glycosyltransferase [Bacteroides helcogenes]